MISFTVRLQGVDNINIEIEEIRGICLEKTFKMQCLPRIGENLNCPYPLGCVERIHHHLNDDTITIIFENFSLTSMCHVLCGDDTWEVKSLTKKAEAKFRQLCKEVEKTRGRDYQKITERLESRPR